MAEPRGTRVVLDARPLQEPGRNPTTALYLDSLLEAFAADPSPGESFLFLLDTPGPDPSPRYPGLPFAGRRRLPPTRRLRAATLTLDPFLLRAASIGTALAGGGRGAGGAGGAVYHGTSGTVPIAGGLPMVVTLLDLAAWELPAVYQRNPAERFGQRLRARLLRDAERIITASEATARAASRFLHVPQERIHVIPLATVLPDGRGDDLHDRLAGLRERLRLPERYLLFLGRYDARKDLATLLGALVGLAEGGPPESGRGEDTGEGHPMPWPPVVVIPSAALAGLTEEPATDEAEALGRLIDREAAWPLVHLTPRLDRGDQATLLAGARALVHPALVEGSGQAVIEALAAGVPVVAGNVGALPEIIGPAGILVEPRDEARLAAAISTMWLDDRIHGRLSKATAKRPPWTLHERPRSWRDVAAETRAVYGLAASRERAAPVAGDGPPDASGASRDLMLP